MSLRRVLGALVALLTIGLGLVATGGSAQAVTWTQVDRHCVSNNSGSLCATTYKSSSGWKGTVTVAPKSGHWMKLTSAGSSHGNYGETLCWDGNPDWACPARVTTNHTWSYVRSGEQMVLGADVKTDTTTLSAYAGRTTWERHASHCATVTEGSACVSLWYQMRRSSFYYKTRVSLTPAAGKAMLPVDTRIAIHYTVYPSTTVKTVSGTTTLSGAATTQPWAAYGNELRQLTDTACDHLGGIFHYRSGGVARSVSVTAQYC